MARPMSETYLPVAYRAVRTRAVEKSVTGARSSLPTTVNGRCSRRRATGGPRKQSLRAKTWQAVTAYSYRLTGVLFHCTTTTTTPVQRPRFQDNLGKPVPVRTPLITGDVAYERSSLRQARLVLGWVTVCGRVHHVGMQPAN